jgi:uncharacterized protein YndB with AHSA1/START domain
LAYDGCGLAALVGNWVQHAVVTDSIQIAASPERVWEVITDREKARIWRSSDFDTDWQEGSPIGITACIGPKRFHDKGKVLLVEPCALLKYEFLPHVSGLPDVPESYSRVVLRLTPCLPKTVLDVEHTVPPSTIRRGKDFEIGPESGEKHVRFYWRSTLPLLRDLAEGRDTLAVQMAVAAVSVA